MAYSAINSFGQTANASLPIGMADIGNSGWNTGGIFTPAGTSSAIAGIGTAPLSLTGSGGIGANGMLTPTAMAEFGMPKLPGADTGSSSLNTGQKLGIGLQGLQTIGGLIGAFGSLGLARDQFNLQKDVLNTNLKNQIQSYNTSLEDKARSRGAVEGTSAADTQSYIDSHKATR